MSFTTSLINRKSASRLFAAAVLGASLYSANTLAEADLTAVPSGEYAVDPTHAYINFQYVHLGLSKPTLSFDTFSIDMNLDTADATKSSIAVEIDAASVLTGSDIFYDHITGGKWFDVAANPTMTFQSTSIEGSGDSYSVTGDLTIKGMTKPVTLDVTINGAMMHPLSLIHI